ncbi:MAG: ribonuclease R, partial [Alicyclobacillus sp.]|nr:ribonuclease R [Alicyclobacillus sp.]
MRLEAYRPLTAEELAQELGVAPGEPLEVFVRLLRDMEKKGEVVRTRTHRYGVPERMNLVVGRLQIKARGYGFLLPDAPGEPDLYIPADELNGAMDGDRVIARLEKAAHGPRREGRIIRVLERAQHRVVGKFTRYRDYGFI